MGRWIAAWWIVVMLSGCGSAPESSPADKVAHLTVRLADRDDNPVTEGAGRAYVITIHNDGPHAVALRGVRFTGQPGDQRDWLATLEGQTIVRDDGTITHSTINQGTKTKLYFEKGLVLPGEDITVTAPIPESIAAPPKGVMVMFGDLGDAAQWRASVLLPGPYSQLAPMPISRRYEPVTDESLARRKGAGGTALVKQTQDGTDTLKGLAVVLDLAPRRK